MAVNRRRQRAAGRADTRVHHDYMHAANGVVGVSLRDREGTLGDVEAGDFVGDVVKP